MNSIIDMDSLVANAGADNPALAQLFGGYFHQDWREEHDGTDDAVRAFTRAASPATVSATAAELDRLIDMGLDDASLSRVLAEGFDCNLVPETEGSTPGAWLAHVRGLLQRETT